MTDEQILRMEYKSFAATSDRTFAASLSASGVAAEDVARAAAQAAATTRRARTFQVLDLTELSDVRLLCPCYRHQQPPG